jgi:hypothetical protein
MRPSRRPRLRRSQLWLPVRRLQLRVATIKALRPTLYQHVEPGIAAIHHARRRGSSRPGNKAAAKRHSHDDHGGYGKAGRANNAAHGHSMRHPRTTAKPRSNSTFVSLRRIRGKWSSWTSLTLRFSLSASLPGQTQLRPRRPCPPRARSTGNWRSLTVNSGRSGDVLTCAIGVVSGRTTGTGRAFSARDAGSTSVACSVTESHADAAQAMKDQSIAGRLRPREIRRRHGIEGAVLRLAHNRQ